MNTGTLSSSTEKTKYLPKSFSADAWMDNLHLAALLGSMPTILFGFFCILMIDNELFTSSSIFQVVEKKKLSPDRYSISYKSIPDEHDGFLRVEKTFFDRVQLGDTIHTGFYHYRVIRNGRLTVFYIPWHKIFPISYLPLAWCLPAFLWCYRIAWFRSLPFIILALISELSFVTALSWVFILHMVL